MTTGERDAAGEGVAAGLGLVAGVVTVLAGEAIGEGDGVTAGEFELFAGSHAATNSVNRIVESNSARLIALGFELLIRELFIRVYLVRTRLKSGRMLLERGFTSNGCSHISFTGISASTELKPSFSKRCLHDLRTGSSGGKPAFLT
ncbi:MAG TPA: hypothetical protein VMZ30_06160 [Pyrinomonadaceae bacterium]|nr:hypothetical protein [Pyrinomonadaceae bacterium]